MNASKECVEAVKHFEGCKLYAYRDARGVLTIGYGHTKGVMMGMAITQKQADEWLAEDLDVAARQVESLGLKLTQGQKDALTDFVFNLGIGKLKGSTLLRLIRSGASTERIQAEFGKWVYAGKKKLAGLVKRRKWEAQMWGM